MHDFTILRGLWEYLGEEALVPEQSAQVAQELRGHQQQVAVL